MAQHRRGVNQISEIANALIDPILARRAGINTLLLGSWEDIAGSEFADCTRPERIRWPKSAADDGVGGGFSPGVLTVACEGARALFFMHAQDQVIQRINAFFGFPAVGGIRIVQKPVANAPRASKPAPLTQERSDRLRAMLAEVDDPKLRASLERLGRGVLAGRSPR